MVLGYKRIGLVLCMLLAPISMLTGCVGNTVGSDVGSLVETSEKSHRNPLDYVSLGDHEEIDIRVDGLEVYVGEVYVDVPYRDEECITEWTLQYYYSQVNPAADKLSWVPPTDEEVAQLGIPEITTFRSLKDDYVAQKVNENDELTCFMRIGDAIMEQVVASSIYEEIPEDVIIDCESIYTDYLEEMLANYNEIGEIPVMQKSENSVYKVLAAMAIAQEAGIDTDGFDYEEVLQYLVEQHILKDVQICG